MFLTQAAREDKEIKYKEAESLGFLVVQRIEKYNINSKNPNFVIFDDLCSHSRSLFNSVSYYCRKLWEKKEKLPSYMELDRLCKHPSPGLEHWQDHYYSLLTQPAQQVLLQFKEAWESYFKAKKAYKVDPSKFRGKPQVPGFISKRNLITIPQNFSIKNGYLHFLHKKKVIPIKLNPKSKYSPDKIVQVKIVPQATSYQIIVIYETQIRKVSDNVINLADQDRRIIGLDLGVNNFLACASNVGLKPFVINGSEIKSLNQYYNKVKAEAQEKLPFYYGLDSKDPEFIGPLEFKKRQKKWSKYLNIITQNRTSTLNDYLHKITKFLVDYCLNFKIDTVVAGYNPT